MSPSRLAKTLLRRLRVTTREQPTQYDIAALEENMRRVGLVIRFRWMLVSALAAFSLASALIYSIDPTLPSESLIANMWIPGAALVFVLGYNTYYQLTYRFLGNIAILNHAQLLFDSLVIGVLVHYSGGVYSWFHTMFALIVLEAAFIFPRPRDTWLVATGAWSVYIVVLVTEFFGIIPHVSIPFVVGDLYQAPSYVAVRALWALTLLAGTALIALRMMASVHKREAQLEATSTADEATGLTNRAYFHRKLTSELQRARCFDQTVGVLLLDIDDFGGFNRRFGLEAGNRMLRAIADVLRREACESAESALAELNTVSRYGGEEFAVILPGAPGMSSEAAADDAVAIAERLCKRVGAFRLHDMGVTVSVGLAMFPRDGLSGADLVSSADQAVYVAQSGGGNRVASSDDPGPGLAV